MDIFPPKRSATNLPTEEPKNNSQSTENSNTDELIKVDDDAQPVGPTLYLNNPTPQKRNREGLKSVLSTVAIIILAPLIAFGLTTFIFQSYEVDGASMETTLQNADRLIVLKAPKTWANITRSEYLPSRGDIIIFNRVDTFETGVTQKKQLVKRVIGMPGDRVVVKDGKVTIYNPQKPDGFDPDRTLDYGSAIETTPGNVDITVMAGELYVMGDNRSNSLDSRTFGPIELDSVVGKLGARIFPFNKFKIY